MIGIAGLLRNTSVARSDLDYVHTLQSCGDTILSMLGDTMDLTALESGQLVLQMRPFDPLETVEAVLKIVSYPAHAKNLEVAYVREGSIPPLVIGDEMRFKQVVTNLASTLSRYGTECTRVAVAPVIDTIT